QPQVPGRHRGGNRQRCEGIRRRPPAPGAGHGPLRRCPKKNYFFFEPPGRPSGLGPDVGPRVWCLAMPGPEKDPQPPQPPRKEPPRREPRRREPPRREPERRDPGRRNPPEGDPPQTPQQPPPTA